MNKNDKIYIAGHTGLVGSSLHRKLIELGYNNIITKTHKDLDLTNQKDTNDFFKLETPKYVFMCAALVGGIVDNNTRRGDFLYQNLMRMEKKIGQKLWEEQTLIMEKILYLLAIMAL